MTASPRASEVMKFGSPVKPSISDDGVTGPLFGARVFVAACSTGARFLGASGLFDIRFIADAMRLFPDL